MENKIIELKAELDMINEVGSNIYHDIHAGFKAIVTEMFVNPFENARLTRLNYNEFDKEISFEIGFFNTDENKIDFGSDMWFTYSVKKGLQVNVGTIGTYGKEDVYQFARVHLLHAIFADIEAVEARLESEMTCNNRLNEYDVIRKKDCEITCEISRIEKIIKAEKIEAIRNNIIVGTQVKYAEDASRSRLFGHSTDKSVWVITKVNRVTVNVESKATGVNGSVNKEDLIKQINLGKINFYEEANA